MRILLVEHDTIFAQSLQADLASMGHRAHVAESGAEPREALALAQDGQAPDAVVVALDSALADAWCALCDERFPRACLLGLSASPTRLVPVAIVRAGLDDILAKPTGARQILDALLRAQQRRELRANLRPDRGAPAGASRAAGDGAHDPAISVDPSMRGVVELVRAAAPARTTVLMTGESGVGKSMLARRIHSLGPRRDRPFVEIACGSIPETLLESELFGHVKGAFTGAHADKPGRFLAADTGTIFLDEINSAPAAMQLKLLRVLQERSFEPVGSERTVEVDVRVVLASNQPLEQLVQQGLFRQDLYYRISVLTIDVPPLRDRPGDIPFLADQFLRDRASELGREIVGFDPPAMDALCRYAFPGNVRELQNIVERAAILCKGQRIGIAALPEHIASSAGHTPRASAVSPQSARAQSERFVPRPLEEAMLEPQRRIILRTLGHCGWNRQRTAEVLGINRATLYKKMRLLGITERDVAESMGGAGQGLSAPHAPRLAS